MSERRQATIPRRSFFDQVGGGFYGAAMAHLLGGELLADEPQENRRNHDLRPRLPLHEPRAKAVIHLFMNGGPSQMDLFDPKEELTKRHGEPYFKKIAGEVEFIESAGALMRSPYKFQQHANAACGFRK